MIGIPAALHLYEDLPFWKVFFDGLGIRTVTSEEYREGVKEGKHAAGAEFCAPMAALHGHVRYLMDKSDYLFLPFYLEKKTGKGRGETPVLLLHAVCPGAGLGCLRRKRTAPAA